MYYSEREWLFPKNDCNSSFSFRDAVPKASQEAPGLWKCAEEGIDPELVVHGHSSFSGGLDKKQYAPCLFQVRLKELLPNISQVATRL